MNAATLVGDGTDISFADVAKSSRNDGEGECDGGTCLTAGKPQNVAVSVFGGLESNEIRACDIKEAAGFGKCTYAVLHRYFTTGMTVKGNAAVKFFYAFGSADGEIKLTDTEVGKRVRFVAAANECDGDTILCRTEAILRITDDEEITASGVRHYAIEAGHIHFADVARDKSKRNVADILAVVNITGDINAKLGYSLVGNGLFTEVTAAAEVDHGGIFLQGNSDPQVGMMKGEGEGNALHQFSLYVLMGTDNHTIGKILSLCIAADDPGSHLLRSIFCDKTEIGAFAI